MTNKAIRRKEYKRLRAIGWDNYFAQKIARHDVIGLFEAIAAKGYIAYRKYPEAIEFFDRFMSRKKQIAYRKVAYRFHKIFFSYDRYGIRLFHIRAEFCKNLIE